MAVDNLTRDRQRATTPHRAAAIISVAFAVFSVVWSLPVLQRGAGNSDQVPYGVVIVGFAISIVTIVAAYGVWRVQRWGVVLTIVMNALSFIVGAPGMAFGPSAFLIISSIIGCAANVGVIVLLLRRRASIAPGAAA